RLPPTAYRFFALSHMLYAIGNRHWTFDFFLLTAYRLGWKSLITFDKCPRSRCIYTSVVVILSLPSICCMALRSAPFCNKWVANECLKVCGLMVLLSPISIANRLMIVNIMARVSCFPLLFKNRISSEPFWTGICTRISFL